MHYVLPPVGVSLAPEDPYQELVLDPLSKKKTKKNLRTIQKTYHQGGRPYLALVLHPYPRTKI